MRPYIGQQIRRIRKEKNITMKQLADQIKLTEQAISQYERGIRKPNEETLNKICTILSIEKKELYVWDISDLAVTMNSIVKIFDRILEDESDINWDDIDGFTSEEFSDITGYIYDWADSIIEKRKKNLVLKSDIQFRSEYIEKKKKKKNK